MEIAPNVMHHVKHAQEHTKKIALHAGKDFMNIMNPILKTCIASHAQLLIAPNAIQMEIMSALHVQMDSLKLITNV